MLGNFRKVLKSLPSIMWRSDTKIVESILVEQLPIILIHAKNGKRIHIKIVITFKSLQQLYHLCCFQCISLHFRKVCAKQLCSFLVAAEKKQLSYFWLVLHLSVVIIRQGSCSDDLDQLVILNFIQLSLQSLEGSETCYLEV